MRISYGYCGIMTWEFEHSIVTSAKKQIIWDLYSRVESWKIWDHGIESVSLEGEFKEGVHGKIKPEGQELLSYNRASHVSTTDDFHHLMKYLEP